jgi:hypothetical protein
MVCGLISLGVQSEIVADQSKNLYNPDEIQRIYTELHPGTLLVPVNQPSRSGYQPGPHFFIYRMHSEMGLVPADGLVAFWEALQEASTLNAIDEFAKISANLTEPKVGDDQIQAQMIQWYVEPELRVRLLKMDRLQGNAHSVVFNRIGCLMTIRYLMLYGGPDKEEGRHVHKIGRLALLGNEFLAQPPVPKGSNPSNLDMLLLIAPTWDIMNARHLGHGMARMFTILNDIMPGNEPKIQTLLRQLALNPAEIEIEGVPLHQFVSIVFGIFAYGGQPEGPKRSMFSSKEIFSQTNFPQAVLDKMLEARAPSLDSYRELLKRGQTLDHTTFVADATARSFLTDELNIFRRYPLLKVDDERVAILDLQLIAELLTQGVYWSIFNSLPSNKRDSFRELWGHMFEVYTVDLLAKFYPKLSGIFWPDVAYKSGQIDVLLDFGSFVLVMEIKASLLTEPAKRSADRETFVRDFRRKFIENEKGHPKVVKQLAGACRGIMNGEIATASGDETPIIYPIFVSDEPTLETAFMNGYFNDEFQKEAEMDDPRVRPLTVMTIDELEQILTHSSDGDIEWEELLQCRFNRKAVQASSVGQALYDMLVSKGVAVKQNQALKLKYDEFGNIMRANFAMEAHDAHRNDA